MVAIYDVILAPKIRNSKMTSKSDVMTSMTENFDNDGCVSLLLVYVPSFMFILCKHLKLCQS